MYNFYIKTKTELAALYIHICVLSHFSHIRLFAIP